MANIAHFKEEHQPQGWDRLKASIRTRLSVIYRASGNCRMGVLPYNSQKVAS
jgi:hypothetical protein